MFNIDELKSIIGKHGVAKPSSFAMSITPPASLYDSFSTDLPYLIVETQLPGKDFNHDRVSHKGYGLTESRPTGMNFDTLTMSVIGDASGKVLGFFEKWMMHVMNFDGENDTSASGIPAETLNYPAEYWGTVELFLYDITSKKYASYKFHKAYPLNIASVSLGWSQVDDLMLIPIGFSYRSPSVESATQLTSLTSVNTLTNSNARNVQQLEQLLINPNIADYQQRLQTI